MDLKVLSKPTGVQDNLSVAKPKSQPLINFAKVRQQTAPLQVQASTPETTGEITSIGDPDNQTPYSQKLGRTLSADLLDEDKKSELSGVVKRMEELQLAPDQIKKVVRGYIEDNAVAQPKALAVELPEKKGIFQQLFGPELTGIASGVRAIQSIPATIGLAQGLITGDQEAANKFGERADRIQKKPLFGANTLAGNTIKQNLGLATQTAGQYFGFGPKALALQTLGSDVNQNKKAKDTIIDTAFAYGGTKLLGAASPYISKLGSRAFEALPLGAKELAGSLGQTVNTGLKNVGKAVDPTLAKLTPEFLSSKTLPETIKQKLAGSAVGSLENTYKEIFTGTKSGAKILNKSAQVGKDPSKFLAENGYVVDVSNGKISSQSLIEKISKDAEPLENSLDEILKLKSVRMPESELISLDDIGRAAKAKINTPSARGAGTLQDQEKAIDNIIDNLKSTYGEKVDLSTLNEIKRGQWRESGSFSLNKPTFMPDVNYSIGNSAKETIENKVGEVSVKKLNNEIGNYWDAVQNLRKIDGNAVKGGRLGKYFNRTLGAVAGSGGGPAGTVAGAVAADYISELMQNNAIATPIKRSILASIPKESPFYREAQIALRQLKFGQPLLNAPSEGSSLFSNNVPINLPASNRPFESGVRSRVEVNPTRLLPRPSGEPTGDYTQVINLPDRSLNIEQGSTRKIGGKMSRRTINEELMKPGQASAPKLRRGSYKDKKAYEARAFQSQLEAIKRSLGND